MVMLGALVAASFCVFHSPSRLLAVQDGSPKDKDRAEMRIEIEQLREENAELREMVEQLKTAIAQYGNAKAEQARKSADEEQQLVLARQQAEEMTMMEMDRAKAYLSKIAAERKAVQEQIREAEKDLANRRQELDISSNMESHMRMNEALMEARLQNEIRKLTAAAQLEALKNAKEEAKDSEQTEILMRRAELLRRQREVEFDALRTKLSSIREDKIQRSQVEAEVAAAQARLEEAMLLMQEAQTASTADYDRKIRETALEFAISERLDGFLQDAIANEQDKAESQIAAESARSVYRSLEERLQMLDQKRSQIEVELAATQQEFRSRLESRVRALESLRAALKQKYADDHPEVRRVDSLLQKLRASQ